MSLSENFDTGEFLLLFRNFNITLAASGTLEAGAKYQYLRTLVRVEALRHRVEALRQFDSFSADVEGTEP